MNKTEVAAELDCSTRQVEKYASEDRLGTIEYVRGKRGREAKYDDEAVARLKAELTVKSQEIIGTAPQSHALQRAPSEQGMQALAPHIADALHVALSARIAVPAPSLLLSIPEAAAWLGVSKYQIEIAIHNGKLIAPKIGRGRRVRPEDLLRLKDKLFATAAKEQKLLGDGKE